MELFKTEFKSIEALQKVHQNLLTDVQCGISIDEGWLGLVHDLCLKIEHQLAHKKDLSVIITQIKEKFGGLRFYIDGGNEYIYGLIAYAESLSYHICEVCGEIGTLWDTGWLKTLCDKHAIELGKTK